MLDLGELVLSIRVDGTEAITNLNNISQSAGELPASFEGVSASIGELIEKATEVSGALADVPSGLEAIGDAGSSVDGASDAMGDLADASGDASGEIDSLGDSASALGGDIDGVGTAADSASGGVDTLAQSASNAGDGVEKLGNSAEGTESKLGSLDIGLKLATETLENVSGKVLGLADDTTSMGDSIDKNSQKLGLSRTAYQEWDQILQHSGSSINALTPVMKNINALTEEDRDVVEAAGISWDEFSQMSADEKLSTIITALQGCTDETERNQLASELLGKRYMELNPLLNTSVEDTEAMRQACHDLGGVMSDELVSASAEYADKMQDLNYAKQGLVNTLMEQLLPILNDLIGLVTDVVTWFNNLDSGTQGIITTVAALAAGILVAVTAIAKIITIAQSVGTVISTITGLAGGLKTGLSALWAVMSANPIGAVIAIIAALVAIFVTLIATNEDFRNKCIEIWNKVKEKAEEIFNGIKDFLTETWNNIKTAISETVENIKTAVSETWENMKTAVSGTTEKLKTAVSEKWEDMKGKVKEKVEDIKKNATEKWEELKKNVSEKTEEMKSKVKEKWEEMKGNIRDKAQEILTNGREKFEELRGAVADKVEEARTAVSDKFGQIKDFLSNFNLLDVGRQIFNSLLDGFKNAWTTITTWVGEKVQWIKDTISSAINAVKTAVTGKHRTGLREVPYDGYVAELHAGERVLTAVEANQYDKWKQGTTTPANNTTINFNGNYQFKDTKDIDYFMSEAGKMIKRKVG